MRRSGKNQKRGFLDVHRQSLSLSLFSSPSPRSPSPPGHIEARQEREHRQQLRVRRPRARSTEAAAGWPPWRLRLPHFFSLPLLLLLRVVLFFSFARTSEEKNKEEWKNQPIDLTFFSFSIALSSLIFLVAFALSREDALSRASEARKRRQHQQRLVRSWAAKEAAIQESKSKQEQRI